MSNGGRGAAAQELTETLHRNRILAASNSHKECDQDRPKEPCDDNNRPDKFHISTINAEGVSYVQVTGDVDIATADELRAAGEDAVNNYTGTIRIGLAGVTFMDSAGLAALIYVNNKAADRHTLILDDVPPQVLHLLELTGLAGHFKIR